MEETYSSGVPDETVRVMCVSNKMYADNRDQPKAVALPRLELSGIIEARRHCMSIVTSAQRRAARGYINDQIPEFLSRLDLWVQSGARSGTVESRLAAIEALDEVEGMLQRVGLNSIQHIDALAD